MRQVKADHPPTIRELLTHTAGLTYGRSEALHDRPYKDANIWGAPTLMEFAERIARVPLAYQPGTQWLYSLAMDVQGAIIEAITGQSLADFMQEHIFAPLKMVDTAFWAPPALTFSRSLASEIRRCSGCTAWCPF